MRYLLLCLSFFLAACSQDTSQSNPNTSGRISPIQIEASQIPAIQSDEWYRLISKVSGVTDAEGHGPDYGSAEWCGAVHFLVYGIRVPSEQTCNTEWFKAIHNNLIQAKP